MTETDSAVVHESCLLTGLAFPAYVVCYENTGDQLLESGFSSTNRSSDRN